MADRHDWTWLWDTERSDGGVVVDEIDIDMPEYDPGQRLTLRLEFWPTHQNFNTETGGTFGGDTGGTYGGSTGFTWGTTNTIVDQQDRYEAVRQYGEYVGRYAPHVAQDGTRHYKEQLPSSPEVDSIVIPIEPSQNLKNESTDGLWVILDDYDDVTTRIPDLAALEFSATVLARLGDYASRTAINNALGH